MASLEGVKVGDWLATSDLLPKEGIIVDTKIDDELGMRNEQQLKRQGRLWFFPDGIMYCYYTPTHWKLPAPIEWDPIEKGA